MISGESNTLEWLPFGEDTFGRLISVDHVESGLACGLICADCRRRLVAKKGDIIRHHFAHEADHSCSGGGGETLLHKLAKQLIADAKGIMLPELIARHGYDSTVVSAARWFDVDDVHLEVWKDGIRPDIIVRRSGRELAIEVHVTHPCGPEKIEFIQSREMPTIEINLSGLRDLLQSGKPVHDIILRTAPRHWLFNGKLDPAINELKKQAEDRSRLAAEVLERQKDDLARRWEADRESRAQAETRRLAEERVRKIILEKEETERAARRLENDKRRQDDLARQEAIRRAEDLSDADRALTKFKMEILSQAVLMLGGTQAETWASKISVTRGLRGIESINLQSYYEDPVLIESRCRNSLETAVTQKALGEKIRDYLLNKATTHFRSEAMGRLWLTSHHPKLEMQSPSEACVTPGGLDRCVRLLQ